MSIGDDDKTPPEAHPWRGRDDDVPSERPTPAESPKARNVRFLPPLPTGPDDIKTPVDLEARVPPSAPDPFRPTPKPDFDLPRDSYGPRPSVGPPTATPRPNYLGVEGKTNPGGLASNAYVKRKVRNGALGVGGAALAFQLATWAFNAYEDHLDRAAQRQVQQRLELLEEHAATHGAKP